MDKGLDRLTDAGVEAGCRGCIDTQVLPGQIICKSTPEAFDRTKYSLQARLESALASFDIQIPIKGTCQQVCGFEPNAESFALIKISRWKEGGS